jgi:hypothetical protein
VMGKEYVLFPLRTWWLPMSSKKSHKDFGTCQN